MTAIAKRDFEAIQGFLHPSVTFRVLVPSGLHEDQDAASAAERLRSWFGVTTSLEFLQQTVDDSLGRLGLSYRLRVRRDDEWQVVEQHAFCSVHDGRIWRMDLICSGFLPAAAPDE